MGDGAMLPLAHVFRAGRVSGYALALVIPLAGYATRHAFDPGLTSLPFVTLFPAVLLVALVAGRGPLVVAVLWSAVLGGPFADDPQHAPLGALLPQNRAALAGLVLFALAALLTGGLVQRLRAMKDALARAQTALADANRSLDARVTARTAELATANRRLQREIAARAESAENIRQAGKIEAIGQLSGGIAHDFNSLLGIVTGNLNTARRMLAQGQGQADARPHIESALDGAQRAAALARRLLDFARPRPLVPVVADVNAVLGGLANMLRPTLGEKIRLRLSQDPDLWLTRIDLAQLESALVNLAVNARDAMPDGGSLTIETANAFLDDAYAEAHTGVTAGQYVRVTVSDTGCGIRPEVMERVFEPFFTTKSAGSGTGLGLAQVQGFIRQSNGHIKLFSDPGQGTVVTLYLARHYGQAPALSHPSPPLPAGHPSVAVLLVETDDTLREKTGGMVQVLGYSVIATPSPEAALAILRQRDDIALLLTDLALPGMSGPELAARALEFRPALRVIHATGDAGAIPATAALPGGAGAVLAKPFGLDQLATTIATVLATV